jgi:hypothetical protein
MSPTMVGLVSCAILGPDARGGAALLLPRHHVFDRSAAGATPA